MEYATAEYVPVFKALSDETRLRIIDILSCGPLCACDLLEEFSISQSTLSYHMRILTSSGLIHAQKDGSWTRYSLDQDRLTAVKAFLQIITSDKANCVCHTRKGKQDSCC